MMIKGLEKITLIDYPEKVACSIFIFGCNFRCPYCFTGKSKVLTDKGIIEIKDIVEQNIDCKVFDFEGNFSNVKKYYKRKVNKLFRIKTFLNSNQIECTENHRFFVYNSSSNRITKKEAKELDKEVDYLLMPIIKNTIDFKLDTVRAIKDTYIKITTKERFNNKDIIEKVKRLRSNGLNFLDKNILPIAKLKGDLVAIKGASFYINNHIALTKDMMRLIGYYLSEGCVIKNKKRKNSYSICFTFSKKEKELINDVSNIFKDIFKTKLKKTENEKYNTITLSSYKGIIGLLFRYYFGSSSHSKKLPTEFLYLDKELQRELIIGLFKGNGISSQHYIKKYQKQRIQLTSQTLLYQISLILWRLGIKHSVYKVEIIIADRKIFDILSQQNLINKKSIDTSKRYGFLDENYVYLKIKSIERIKKVEKVYNLEISNPSHSYNINLIAVSNCHNPELVIEDGTHEIDQEKILQFLEERKSFIDGVCVTGGEPTLNENLPDFLKKIKDIGFSVKLDTNGTNPEMLEQLVNAKLIDYIAMDIKAPLEKYEEVVRARVDLEKIKKSVEIIRNSGLDYEFRMTVPPGFFDESDFLKIGKWLNGSKRFYLQQFRGIKTLDKKFVGKKPVSKEELEKFCNILKPFFKQCEIR